MGSKPTIQTVAQMAGVSRGTVDRVLNGRAHVREDVRLRVLEAIRQSGYVSPRDTHQRQFQQAYPPMKLGVLLPNWEGQFRTEVDEGIAQAQAELESTGIHILIRRCETDIPAEALKLLDELTEAGASGLAVCAANDPSITARISALADEGIPCVTFNSDLPDSGRLCYVGVDNFACGRMSAGLMDLLLAGHGEVLLVAGQENNWSHQQRVDGFQTEAAANFPGLSLLPPQTCGDDQQLAHDIVCRAVKEHPSLRGVYVSVNGQLGACDALRELGLQGKVHLICHDLIPANAENVRRGLIDFLIDQDAALQGARPIELLMDYLLAGEKPETDRILACIDIRNRYNV